MPLLALYHGLLYVFEGYKLSPGQMFEQASNLGAHFEAVSARIGVALVPPERYVDQVAHAFLNAGEIDRAIGLFAFNASRNPASLNAYNSLGGCLRRQTSRPRERALIFHPSPLFPHPYLYPVHSHVSASGSV